LGGTLCGAGVECDADLPAGWAGDDKRQPTPAGSRSLCSATFIGVPADHAGKSSTATKKGQVDAGDSIVTALSDRYNAVMGG